MMTKVERIQYYKDYYQRNKKVFKKYYKDNQEKIKKYQKASYNLKPNDLKIRKIEPTEDEYALMKKGMYNYLCLANKARTRNYLREDEISGEGYIGLLKGLDSWKRNKDKVKSDKNYYIINRVKGHLIDRFRQEIRARNKYQPEYITSLSNEIGDGIEFGDLIEHKDKDQHLKIDSKFFELEIKQYFIDNRPKIKISGDDLYEIFMMRIMHNKTFKEISIHFGICESRVNQIYNNTCVPLFDSCKVWLRNLEVE